MGSGSRIADYNCGKSTPYRTYCLHQWSGCQMELSLLNCSGHWGSLLTIGGYHSQMLSTHSHRPEHIQ